MLKNIGVTLDIRQVASSDFSSIIVGRKFDSGFIQNDPFGMAYICQIYCSDSQLNHSRTNDPAVDPQVKSVNEHWYGSVASVESKIRLRTTLRKQLAELDRQEDRFLDLIGDLEWPQEKIKTRMQTVRESKQRITHQLDGTIDDLEPGRAVLYAALELLDRPRDLYDAATDEVRKMLNKAIFTRLYLDSTDRRPTTTTATLSEPFASLIHAARATDGSRRPQTSHHPQRRRHTKPPRRPPHHRPCGSECE